MLKILPALIALALLLPNFFDKEVNPVLQYDHKEKYNPQLSKLNAITTLETHIDSIAAARQISTGSFEYAELIEKVIAERFYHGFSHYTTAENWIAAFAGRLIKEDFACKVQPEEIMQKPNAACSQQTLVMMQLLRNKKISYRSVGFPHHYAMEILINNEWYFFDANMEPAIDKEHRALSYWQHKNDSIKKYYDVAIHRNLNYQFGCGLMATTGAINEIPAQKAKYFHIITGVLSKICWLFPLLLVLSGIRINVKKPFISFAFPKRKSFASLSA